MLFFGAGRPVPLRRDPRRRQQLTTDGGPELIQRLSQHYTGGPYSYDEGTDNVRVVARITPDRVINR